MIISYVAYLEDRGARRFGKLLSVSLFEKIFYFLESSNSVHRMIKASQDGRPALEAVIEDLEVMFTKKGYDIKKNMKHRQITGSMVRFILSNYNYYPNGNTKLKKGHYIKTAIKYEYIK
jgi:hypothetical protein